MPEPDIAPTAPLHVRLPSLNFLLLLLVFAGTGAALWHGLVSGHIPVLVFVLSGWVVSLCLHEFAHASTAYLGGDTTMAASGYLSLDPLRYTDPMLSLVLPLIYLLLGGFGMPGGAVYIRTDLLRGTAWRMAVSAAGPLANLACLGLLGLLYAAVPHGRQPSDLEAAVAVLAYVQATAVILNLLPFPGLDGFGILQPLLPDAVAAPARQIGTAGFILLVLLMWYTSLGGMVANLGFKMCAAAAIDPYAILAGVRMLRFL